MLIDYILDRKDNIESNQDNYNVQDFYDYCLTWYDEVTQAIESGDEKAVKKALCDYITKEYNPDICKFIESVTWLTGKVKPCKVVEYWVESWDNYMGSGEVYPVKERADKDFASLQDEFYRFGKSIHKPNKRRWIY